MLQYKISSWKIILKEIFLNHQKNQVREKLNTIALPICLEIHWRRTPYCEMFTGFIILVVRDDQRFPNSTRIKGGL
jgi:hypothetical protein